MRDADNYYSVTTVQIPSGVVTTRRVKNGTPVILGQMTARLGAGPGIRSVSSGSIFSISTRGGSVFVDAAQVSAVEDVVLPQEGQVGLIALGSADAYFDGLHILDLVSNRTFSKPAAY